MMYFCKIIAIVLVLNIFSASAFAAANPVNNYIDNGGYILSRAGQNIAVKNADRQFIPASITKIITSLAALSILGADYHFQTFFYYDQAANLYIKGGGDPFLISEEIDIICRRLKALGVNKVNDIILAPSAFALSRRVDGAGNSLNPYDVDNSALAVNFNTINIVVAANGKISSAEPQTPNLAIMARLGKDLAPGIQRINISNNKENSLQYAGELFAASLVKNNIPMRGKIITNGTTPVGKALYIHRSSRTLAEMIKAMMQYSNNYIANQIFLVVGAKEKGWPATWEKGRKTLQSFIAKDLGLSNDQINISEGSGLSRRNYITPKAMIKVLNRFKPYANLLPTKGRNLVKSGTLTGVYSFAGYFPGQNSLDSFVIILNQKRNSRQQIYDLLEKMHQR